MRAEAALGGLAQSVSQVPDATLWVWAGGVTALAAAVFAAGKLLGLLRRAVRAWNRVEAFLVEWNGDPSVPPDDPRRRGAMARITATEHEVRRNGGGSIKDAVARIEARQVEHGEAIERLEVRAETNAANIAAGAAAVEEVRELAEGARDAAAAGVQAQVDHEQTGRRLLSDVVRQLSEQGVTIRITDEEAP